MSKYFLWISLLAFVLSLSISCKNGDSKTEELEEFEYTDQMERDLSLCPNKVTSIFNIGDTSSITQHNFELRKAEAIENVSFENGLQLKLRQSGCQVLKQRYEFVLPTTVPVTEDNQEDAAFWIDEAAKQFEYLTTFADDFIIYQQLILAGRDYATLNEPLRITQDAGFTINHFQIDNQTIIVVEVELM